MRFWDTSAIVPLLVTEPATSAREAQLHEDEQMLVWWGTAVECASALQRLGREGALKSAEIRQSEERLKIFETHWAEVEPTPLVRQQAQRLLRLHPLRAGDSLQLAAALVACSHDPAAMPFVTAGERLAEAARREGFAVLE
ncbi:MAG: type II toxin-antitoxin system VapC family toxin [Opitutaceae bacterium]